MPLQILIVHDFGVTRRIARDYILAELSDAVVDLAASSHEAITLLNQKKYRVVLCGLEEAAVNEFAVYKQGGSADTVFIMMTSSYGEEKRARLSHIGIEYVLPMPFSSLDLRDMILKAVDGRSNRLHDRFIIPQTRAIINLNGKHIIADVVNISRNGVLFDINCPEDPINLTTISHIAIQFPADYGGAGTGWITSRLLRLNVMSWHENGAPMLIRGAWSLVNLSDVGDRVLGAALEKARRELAAAEAESQECNLEHIPARAHP